MMQIIALLGRPDAPSDGVQDYCEYLGSALAGHVAQSGSPVWIGLARDGSER